MIQGMDILLSWTVEQTLMNSPHMLWNSLSLIPQPLISFVII